MADMNNSDSNDDYEPQEVEIWSISMTGSVESIKHYIYTKF